MNPTKLTLRNGWVGVATMMAVLCMALQVSAVDLPPGGAVGLSGVSGGPGPGSVVHDDLIPFEIRDTNNALLFAGELQNRVVRRDATGTLAFVYAIRNTEPGLNGAVDEVHTKDFATFLTDVEYSTTSLGTIAPTRAQRTTDGSTVTFLFGGSTVTPGTESRFMHISTEAIDFELNGSTKLTLQSGESVTLTTAMPVRRVEPGCREIDFEDLSPGTTFPVGAAFATNGVLLRVREFYFYSGIDACVDSFTGGHARVMDSNMACGSGNELGVNNVNIEFDYGVPLTELVIHYGEYGGNINLEINGECHNAPNFADLPVVIGGVQVSAVDNGTPGNSCGRLTLEGPINGVRIGGQELWIDDIFCAEDVCADDLEPPIAELDEPPPASCVCDPVTITGTADDANFDRYRLEYQPAGGGTWSLINESTTAVVNGVLGVWNAGGLSQGYYLIRLTVFDVCRQSSTAVRLVWLGTEFDNLTIREPDNGDVVGRTVCIDGTVWDNACFDEYVVEYRPAGGGTWMPVEPGTPVYTSTVINDPFAHWETDTLGLPDGDYLLRVTAVDDCGNEKQEMREVVVDNTAPIAEITSPEPCSFVEGLVEIRGTALDDNLGSWVVQYTGGGESSWVTIASGNTPVVDDVLAVWDTSSLDPCPYTLRLIVRDEAVLDCNGAINHRTEYTVSVNVGQCRPFDADGDGDVDLHDVGAMQLAFTGPLP